MYLNNIYIFSILHNFAIPPVPWFWAIVMKIHEMRWGCKKKQLTLFLHVPLWVIVFFFLIGLQGMVITVWYIRYKVLQKSILHNITTQLEYQQQSAGDASRRQRQQAGHPEEQATVAAGGGSKTGGGSGSSSIRRAAAAAAWRISLSYSVDVIVFFSALSFYYGWGPGRRPSSRNQHLFFIWFVLWFFCLWCAFMIFLGPILFYFLWFF